MYKSCVGWVGYKNGDDELTAQLLYILHDFTLR